MEASTRTPPDPPRVLVVDDEDDITGVLADILEEQGYAVDVASDGDEAWERAQEDPYDVVIIDLKMPRMGGLELLREIRRAEHPSIVIMMTGFATVETAIEALKIGAYDYILKPFKVGELLQVVERAMEKIRLEAENLHLREQIALLKLSEAVSSSLSLDEVLRIVVEAACREVGADAVELWFRPPKADGFTRRIGLGPEGETPALLAAPDRIEALVNGLPHLRLQGERLQELLSNEARGRVGTLLAVPLRRGGQTLGLLNAYSRRKRDPFRPRDEKALVVLGDRATASLENALLYADLESTFRETIQGLALALETKDAYTHGHSENVTRLAVATARQMGLDPDFCETLRQAGLLHDIGKIGISSSILNKPGRLTPEEYEIIKSHPAMGRRILEPISFLREVVPIVYHHHERFDGEGYPEGLAGEEIPLASRVMAVADTYDAMTSDRAYRRGLSHDVAVAELDRCAGTQFDPECVRAFLAAHSEPNRKP
ncbi:HD domain-containing phosphohydrolase [Deferrisoma camini]|uniref:HD domain-containing phosphohydrolase n=1 Tax=Deferrisoma camini TaxID=1035120 RepID=UPI00046D2265|nr:HD domain-containing phosphohydrolase [Deferrisoma camini]